jgi:hypothetical protein
VALALTEVAPLRMRIRGMVLAPFKQAKQNLKGLDEIEDIEPFANKLRRQLEVAGELASRQFEEGFSHIVDRLQGKLEERFEAVMTELAPNLPQVRLSSGALLITPDQMQRFQNAQRQSQRTSRTGATVGGLAGGGAAFATAGALLGPIGLMAGALIGWKLSSVLSGQRNLDRARAAISERLDEIAATLLTDVDAQVNAAVETVRHAVDRRRRAFAHDLYQQFDIVHAISEDAESLASYRRDVDRFDEAFDACADRA